MFSILSLVSFRVQGISEMHSGSLFLVTSQATSSRTLQRSTKIQVLNVLQLNEFFTSTDFFHFFQSTQPSPFSPTSGCWPNSLTIFHNLSSTTWLDLDNLGGSSQFDDCAYFSNGWQVQPPTRQSKLSSTKRQGSGSGKLWDVVMETPSLATTGIFNANYSCHLVSRCHEKKNGANQGDLTKNCTISLRNPPCVEFHILSMFYVIGVVYTVVLDEYIWVPCI